MRLSFQFLLLFFAIGWFTPVASAQDYLEMERLFERVVSTPNKDDSAMSAWNTSLSKLFEKGQYISAVRWSNLMLEHVKVDPSFSLEEVEFLRLTARINKVRLEFEKSLELYQILVIDSAVVNDPELLAAIYIDLAEFNRATFNHALGLDYINKAQEAIGKGTWPLRLEARMLGRKAALIAEGQNDKEKVVELSRQVLKIAEQIDDVKLIAEACNELAFALQSDASIPFYERSINAFDKIESRRDADHVRLNLARCYNVLNKTEEGVKLARGVMVRAKKDEWRSVIWSAYEFLASAYAKAGQWDSASLYTSEALRAATALQEERHSMELTNALAEHEATIAKNALKLQNEELARANIELENKQLQRDLFLVIGIGITTALLLFVFLYSKIRKVNKRLNAQQVITDQVNEQLKVSLEQQQMLIREVHHRVKNNLQVISGLLRFQSKELEDKDAIQAVQQTIERVRSIAMIHEKLQKTDELKVVDFRNYLEGLGQSLRSAMGDRQCEIKIHTRFEGDVSVNMDQAMPLGLIVTELVTNAFKHAFVGHSKGNVWISFTESENDCLLVVQDDGIGHNDQESSGGSLGMSLIRMLTRQLRAECSTENRDGTRYEISFSKGSSDSGELEIT